MGKSLRSRLIALISVCTLLFTAATSTWMYVSVRHELSNVLDRRLASSANMVASMLDDYPEVARSGDSIIDRALGVPRQAEASDSLACEINLIHNGHAIRTLARTANGPDMRDSTSGYSTRTYNGQSWRTYTLVRGNIRITTADLLQTRESLLRDIGLTAAVPFGVALAGVLVMLWFAVTYGLAPIERIKRVIEKRSPNDDEPIRFRDVPGELRPLTSTIEQLVERMHVVLERERQFTDAAAHELRTPLAATKIHLQVLDMAIADLDASPVARESLQQAHAGMLRTQRVVDQLLQLARIEGTDGDAIVDDAWEVCDVEMTVRLTLEQLTLVRADMQRVNFSTQLSSPTFAALPETLLVMALTNLIDNALRHSGTQAPVDIFLSTHSRRAEIVITDRGRGIAQENILLAPRRFWRGNANAPGSGLGLSIVSAIAQRFDSELTLGHPTGHDGLKVTLSIPLASTPDEVPPPGVFSQP